LGSSSEVATLGSSLIWFEGSYLIALVQSWICLLCHIEKSIFFVCDMRNSICLGVSIISTWNSTCSFLGFAPSSVLTCIFLWDLLPTLYIMRLWALILYHVIRAIVLEKTMRNRIHYLQYNTTIFGVNCGGVLHFAYVVNS